MKNSIKNFLFRGLLVSSGGPLVYAIIMLILKLCNVDTTSDGLVIFKAIISTWLLAFICGGASIIWIEEKLGLSTQILIHGSALYISYLAMYLINGWLKDGIIGVIVFSIVFIVTYAIIMLVIYIVEKKRAERFNKELKK